MNKRFAEKGTVVTGGGSGIGKATALRLAREGASVLVADVQEDKARETAEEIKKAGGQAEAFRVDLTRISEIDSLIREAVKLWGRLDILVNSAGLVKSQPFLEVTEADYDKIMDVNLKGTAFCVQKACAQMLAQIPPERRGLVASDRCNGKIVNLSSISGRRGGPTSFSTPHRRRRSSASRSRRPSPSPSTDQCERDLPSVVHTPMWEQNNADKAKSSAFDPKKESDEFISKIPMKRPGTAEEMAAAICFLCSPDADYITGQTLNVDGGFEMN
jgi:meso-butanediol dehydrogenase/(S,S)-butanediol dehydrogenase/diacetyl reductase